MTVFSKIEYLQPDIIKCEADCAALCESFNNAQNYSQARKAFFDFEKLSEDFENEYQIAYIRNTLNMADEFYDREISFFNEALPRFAVFRKNFDTLFLQSEFIGEFKREFGEQLINLTRARCSTNDEAITSEQVSLAGLCTRYQKCVSSLSTDFYAERVNLYGLLKHMNDPKRSVRKAAYTEWAKLYEKASPELNEIYSQMVKLRTKCAEKLGYPDFTALCYESMNRFTYNRADVAAFRENVRRYIVPLAQKVREAQRKRLCVDKLCYYDEELMFPLGNPAPIGSEAELVEKAEKMYKQMSPETAEFFSFMRENELFDLPTRINKDLGGYSTLIPKQKAPFIFANFNSTSADVDVLTHEAGHAFQYYMASRCQELPEYVSSTCEVDEIHSMSMEQFAYPYMKDFFGDRTEEYIASHLANALSVIPYLVCVDEFQHGIYEQPEMSEDERYSLWSKIEKKYMPWRDYDGNEFLSSGGFWMQKQHIFLYPFYYIDYALAQMGGFEFYLRSLDSFEKAFSDYMTLIRAGGSKGYTELLKMANLHSPFEASCVKTIAEGIQRQLALRNMI